MWHLPHTTNIRQAPAGVRCANSKPVERLTNSCCTHRTQAWSWARGHVGAEAEAECGLVARVTQTEPDGWARTQTPIANSRAPSWVSENFKFLPYLISEKDRWVGEGTAALSLIKDEFCAPHCYRREGTNPLVLTENEGNGAKIPWVKGEIFLSAIQRRI